MKTPQTLNGFTLLIILTAFGFIMLGVWQLQRLQWKEGILSSISKSDLLGFEPIEHIIAGYKNLPSDNLKSVRLKGRFRHDLEMQIIPRTLKGRAGAHLLTPFALSSGKVVLINRGWIPQALNQPIDIKRPPGEIALFGFIRQPTSAGLFTPQNDVNKGLWFHININEMMRFLAARDKVLAQKILPFYVMQRPDKKSAGYPVAIDFLTTLPNNHLQYALTWFFLAFGLILGYISYTRKS